MAEADQVARDRGAAEMATGEIAVLLDRRLGAKGSTLSERLEQAGLLVPGEIASKIRFIEYTRDLLMKSEDAMLGDREAFDAVVDEVIAWLTGPGPAERRADLVRAQQRPKPQKILAFGMLGVALLLIAVAAYGILTAG